jgi:DNA-binding HxlR family transcriptional regulator
MNCPVKREAVEYTISILGGKWKWYIVAALSKEGVMRYSELKNALPGITHKMISQQLKELEAEEIVFRNEYHQVPPKVEYSLTEKGATLFPILLKMSEWGEENYSHNVVTND